MDNRIITQGAIAFWASNEPEDELKKMGFTEVDAANLKHEDICLIADFQTSALAFGMVQKLTKEHISFVFYEEIGGLRATMVQFPKKNILVHKLKNSAEDHEDSFVLPIK